MSTTAAVPEFVDSQAVREYLLGLQQRIVGTFEQLDGKLFHADSWEKPTGSPLGGGGLTRIIEEGNLLERGGVGFSHVVGSKLPPSATAQRPELSGRGFEAIGVSLVFHPRNPHVPTVHMNVRFFIAKAEGQSDVYWFGGGNGSHALLRHRGRRAPFSRHLQARRSRPSARTSTRASRSGATSTSS